LLVAPKDVQNTQKLLNTGWVLASIDNKTSGLVPVNYIRGPKQLGPTPNSQFDSAFNGPPIVVDNQEDVLQMDSVLLGDQPLAPIVETNIFDENVLT
jgi:hypothetical protein